MSSYNLCMSDTGAATAASCRLVIIDPGRLNGHFVHLWRRHCTEFQSTILSRFDAIFIVLDERNEEKDTNLSKYVMSMHARAAAPQNQGHGVDASNAPINVATLKRYVTYCRTKCTPVRSSRSSYLLST